MEKMTESRARQLVDDINENEGGFKEIDLKDSEYYVAYGFLSCLEAGRESMRAEREELEDLREWRKGLKGVEEYFTVKHERDALRSQLAEKDAKMEALRKEAESAHADLEFLAVETDEECMSGCPPAQRLTMEKISKIANNAASGLWKALTTSESKGKP